ncbi:La- protein 4B [Haplosporangium sp. Z 27]|nr:La- protein 4B [Haplosporangium sp. Z 27]
MAMNGSPVLTQFPANDPSVNNIGEIPPQPQSHQTQTHQRYYNKKGNRSNGNINTSQHAGQSRNSNNRNHSNYSRYPNYSSSSSNDNEYIRSAYEPENQGRMNNTSRSHSNNGNMNNHKDIRTYNQRQNYRSQSNPRYIQNDYYTQGRSHNNINNSGRMDLPPNHRKYSNDSGIMIQDSYYRQPGPHPLPAETYPQNPSLAMSRSSSYESVGNQPPDYRMRGHPPGSHPEAFFDERYNHNTGIPHQMARPIHAASQHSEDSFSSERPWVPPTEVIAPGFPDGPYSFQPAYMTPWGYSPNIVHEPPQMIPSSSYSPKENLDSQTVIDTRRKSTSSPNVSAGSNEDHDGRDRLREQLEWYFSPRNLATDTYLVSKMNADRWVPISVIAEFKKVKEITDDIQEVVKALRRSSMVEVNESGGLVKAVIVDRPRTTLILRELPEDTTSEDVAGIFAEACPAKSIRKESVGNMWFVEFDTAEDALAMLMHTRGRYLRNTPIAARLKSNTVLTGGEYRETQKMPCITRNPVVPGPGHIWPSPPPNSSDEQSVPGMPMPYRRFPIEENVQPHQQWNSTQAPSQFAQNIVHPNPVDRPYPAGVYFSPNAYGIVPTVPANYFCMSSQMWIPAPTFPMSPQEAQHFPNQDLPHPEQVGFNHIGVPFRDDNPEFHTQNGSDSGDGTITHRGGYNNQKSQGQYRRRSHQEGTEYQQKDAHYYGYRNGYENRQHDGYNYRSPRGYGRYTEVSDTTQLSHSNPNNENHPDLPSTCSSHPPNNIRKRKNKQKNRGPKNYHRVDQLPNEEHEGREDQVISASQFTAQTRQSLNTENLKDAGENIIEELKDLAIVNSVSVTESIDMNSEEAQRITIGCSNGHLENEPESKPRKSQNYWKNGNGKKRGKGRQSGI